MTTVPSAASSRPGSTLDAMLLFTIPFTVIAWASSFPAIRADFPESSLADLSWIFNAYNVVFAALLVPAGRLADRVGRRRLFLIGLVVFGVAWIVPP